MATLAVYNTKGGVGKTSLAVNLAWAAATHGRMRTLLWDLDAQAASTFILGDGATPRYKAKSVLAGAIEPSKAISATATPDLDLLPADASLRSLDLFLKETKGQAKWVALLGTLNQRYECVIMDCPPGLGSTSEEIIRGASIILVPMIPSTLSVRACDEICEYVGANLPDAPPIFPVFTMVDRRRTAHRLALAADPGFPVVPMSSVVELMADQHAAVGVYAARSPAARAFLDLWKLVEPKIPPKS